MSLRATVTASLAVFLACAGTSWAAPKEALKKIDALNTAALASFKAGEHEKAKSQLMEAVVLGKESDLDTNAVMAKTYLNLGVVYADGLKDQEKAQRYFALARRITPKILVPPGLASKTVMAAFNPTAEAARPKDDGADKKRAAAAAAENAEAEHKRAEEQKRADEAKAKELADAQKKEREAREQAQRDRADADKQLGQLKETEKKEREAREKLQSEKTALEKQLAAARDSEKKEREAREKLEKELAAAKEREAKERTAKEGLEKEKQEALAREKDRKSQEEKERLAREKLAEGPDMPSQVPQPLYCAVPEEAPQNTELFVHCVAQENVKAKGMALYYRPSGVFQFNSLAMDRSKKGWFTAVVPARHVTGKVLQYYAEAVDSHGDRTASNGKPTSPNILTLRPAGSLTASQPRPAEKLVPAREVTRKTKTTKH